MLDWLLAVVVGATTFLATNMDNLVLVSVVLVGGVPYRAAAGGLTIASLIVVGACWFLQYAGEMAIGAYVHWLGLLPIALGVWRGIQLFGHSGKKRTPAVASVAAVTGLLLLSSLDSMLTLSIVLADVDPPYEFGLVIGYMAVALAGAAMIRFWRLPAEAKIVRVVEALMPLVLVLVGLFVLLDTPID